MKSFVIKTSFFLLGISACIGYGIFQPKSRLGHYIFYVGYSLPMDRLQFLLFYEWSLRQHNANSAPSDINNFLIKRLSNSGDLNEWQAIITFYITMDTSCWPKTLVHLPDSLKKRMIDNIFLQLDSLDSYQSTSALFLIESLRSGHLPYKGGFNNFWIYDRGKYKVNTAQVKIVKKSFSNWWGDGSTWPANKNKRPLDGTGTAIISP
jgi:hypothetical protein